jgi:hypothetical protein
MQSWDVPVVSLLTLLLAKGRWMMMAVNLDRESSVVMTAIPVEESVPDCSLDDRVGFAVIRRHIEWRG